VFELQSNPRGIGCEIERAPRDCRQVEQRARSRASHAEFEGVSSVQRSHLDQGVTSVALDCPSVTAFINTLHSRYGACGKKVSHLHPIVRRPESDSEDDLVFRSCCHRPASLFPHLARRASVGTVERIIESSYTSESGRESDFRDGQVGLVEEALREMQSPGLGNRNRRRPDVFREQSIKVTGTHPQLGR
jgi:hypothetical protein